MRLFVLRHGKSPQLSEAGVDDDFDRPLAPEGREAVRRMSARLKEAEGSPAVILTSPLVRARETAREAAAILKAPVVEFPPLENMLPAQALWDGLKPRLDADGDVLVVGHQPQLGALVAYLTGSAVQLRPGGLVVLEITEERMRILWAQNP